MLETTPRVTLVRFTPDPEELIASAAKLCYAANTGNILDQEYDKAAGFVDKLLGMGHMSPIEHATFTFLLEGVSRALTHQLVRHRLASYSQRSQRYVKADNFEYIMPPALKGKKVKDGEREVDAEDFFRDTMRLISDRYRAINAALGEKGESTNEDARYVLPNACETKIFVTMNARELIHFFEERLCSRAQWEIRSVANLMLERAREACPAVFNRVGPKCVRRGSCPEGAKTCGKMPEMRKRYLGVSAR